MTRERPTWRAVAIPSEHGGWGLTLEPALLGLLIAFSGAGVAIGLAAMLAFVARTPLKIALVDRRRQRSLPRTRLATRIAATEVAILVALAALAIALTGWNWLVPVAVVIPLFAVELWFDIRSRSRRLIPELCGAIGISAITAAVVIAGNEGVRLAAAASMILAARSIASIPFVRTQIDRLHHGSAQLAVTDAFQLGGVVVGAAAIAVDDRVLAGSIAVLILAALQVRWMRREIPPVKVLGISQMLLGFAIVGITAVAVIAAG